ncbi:MULTISPECIES: DUF4006 family protein [unclassified Nitratiruptor]|uniref:DUF4006 family protein n=1 Tax=unclassified Nitratiruptor TaxID=2624044 RepID=UPI001915B967|nr:MULTISPECIES: DUF4006 family protein [unclassified Nitratiruptor]BCD60913.1 hypothetical protein NitYY0810_C1691 [Nitratiruptor sp. YY08-10]BCD64845.1 hypothetical protein NitYY0814_C1699 [Nitratiruptor sp. YY08-14]
MENRSIWSFHGLTGYFIAVALLLSILAFLSAAAIKTQNATAQQYYEVKDPFGIKMFGPDLENEKHIIVHGTPVGGDVKHKYQFVEK